jgi:hypothetical protein
MTCMEVAEFLMDYVERELPSRVRQEFDFHLRECPTCVQYLENYREAIRLARHAHSVEGPADLGPLPEDLVRAILDSLRAGG